MLGALWEHHDLCRDGAPGRAEVDLHLLGVQSRRCGDRIKALQQLACGLHVLPVVVPILGQCLFKVVKRHCALGPATDAIGDHLRLVVPGDLDIDAGCCGPGPAPLDLTARAGRGREALDHLARSLGQVLGCRVDHS